MTSSGILQSGRCFGLPLESIAPMLAILVLLCACNRIELPESGFPDTEIVYQTATDPGIKADFRLGFINSDGTDLSFVEIPAPSISSNESSPTYPLIKSDNSLLVVEGVTAAGYAGRLSVISSSGEIIMCGETNDLITGSLSLTDNQNYVIVTMTGFPTKIAQFDLEACLESRKPSKTIIEIPGVYEPCEGGGASLSPSRELLAFPDCSTHNARIVVLDLAKKKGLILGHGIAPAWSPNGNLIAYRGLDGIHVVHSDGEDDRLLVEYGILEGIGSSEDWPPTPFWSPDGTRLIYHKCDLSSWPTKRCWEQEEYAIFILNIETGEEVKIINGGVNPYWRKTNANP
jgi:hypothetical protein